MCGPRIVDEIARRNLVKKCARHNTEPLIHPPAVVADIALDVEGRGRYEVRQRTQGLGQQGRSNTKVSRHETPTKMRTDGGGLGVGVTRLLLRPHAGPARGQSNTNSFL